MNVDYIRKVSIISEGRIAIFPIIGKAMYQHIYREGSGVYWDGRLGCFHSTPPTSWSQKKWYQHILGVVISGVGLRLLLTSETEYESDDAEFSEMIKLADQEFHR